MNGYPSFAVPQEANLSPTAGPGQTSSGDGTVLLGTVQTVSGSTVTVVSARPAPTAVTVTIDTTVTRAVDGIMADVRTGVPVSVMGRMGEDGVLQASYLIIRPEGQPAP